MKFGTLFLPLLMLSSLLSAQEPDSSSAAFKLRQAERSFARSSVMFGRQAAFAEWLAEKSVIFTDKWITSGKEYSKNSKPSTLVLKWEPEFNEVSSSGDFGISLGPWEAQEYRPYTKPLTQGYFLSVWQKQKDGSWKVILDFGILTPPLINYKHQFRFTENTGKASQPNANLPDEADKRLLASWISKPVPDTYREFFSEKPILMHAGHIPAINSDSITSLLEKQPKNLRWSVSGSGVASSGDIGFTYGMLQDKSGQTPKGTYVRIWKKSSGEWKILVDLIDPAK